MTRLSFEGFLYDIIYSDHSQKENLMEISVCTCQICCTTHTETESVEARNSQLLKDGHLRSEFKLLLVLLLVSVGGSGGW
jgi:hypothetical protein